MSSNLESTAITIRSQPDVTCIQMVQRKWFSAGGFLLFCCEHIPTLILINNGKGNWYHMKWLPTSHTMPFRFRHLHKSKWVWSVNTTATNRRQTHGTSMKIHRTLTVTRHQEDNNLSLYHQYDCKAIKDAMYCIIKLRPKPELQQSMGRTINNKSTRGTKSLLRSPKLLASSFQT